MSSSEQRTTDLERRTTALEAAEYLTDSLDDNTDALDRVTRKYRWNTFLGALLVLALLVTGKTNYDGHINRCESGNELRREINIKFDAVADSLERGGIGGTPGEDELLKILHTDIDPRDCSEIDWLGR